MNIADMRKDYAMQSLDLGDVTANPFEQFQIWLKQAIDIQALEPTAMHLATVGKDNRPSARIVLLKGIEAAQLMFYTNYESRKATELALHPYASLTFFWAELERQVRIEGKITQVAPDISTAYFQSRPRESQLGAWASPQSKPIADRDILVKKYAEVSAKFEGEAMIERPANWGGYALSADYFEFWQGRPSRLHDRICYRQAGKVWDITRLAP